MKRVEWGDEYRVGIAAFDRQHQQLLALLDHLIACFERDASASEVGQALEELLNLTRTHFADEERFMQARAFAGLKPHRLAHAEFLAKVDELKRLSSLAGKPAPAPLVLYLRRWLTHHIREEDVRYGSCIDNC